MNKYIKILIYFIIPVIFNLCINNYIGDKYYLPLIAAAGIIAMQTRGTYAYLFEKEVKF